jgi:uncharacterized membrane protein
MTETGTHNAVTDYLTSLRAALADLPPTEVEEILDDVGPHIGEVATELATELATEVPEAGTTEATQAPADQDDLAHRLSERLGEPEQYAAELRAAAGYPPREPPQPSGPPRPRRAGLRLALWLLIAATVLFPLRTLLAMASDGDTPGVLLVLLAAIPAALSLIIVLRSRGGIEAFAELPEVRWLRARTPGGAVAEYGRLLQPGWWLLRALIATLLVVAALGSWPPTILFVPLSVPLVLGSVWLGRRSKINRRWLWAVLPLNAFALVVGLALLYQVPTNAAPYADTDGNGQEVVPMPVPAFGNIYPYDANGKPLYGVYLYDEKGRPITPARPVSECRPANQVPPPANQYPQPVYEYSKTSGCVSRSAVPAPSQLPTPSTTAPSPTPTS